MRGGCGRAGVQFAPIGIHLGWSSRAPDRRRRPAAWSQPARYRVASPKLHLRSAFEADLTEVSLVKGPAMSDSTSLTHKNNEPAVVKWEYMELTRKTEAFLLNDMNQLGDEGWELVTVLYRREAKMGESYCWTAIMKRPRTGDRPPPRILQSLQEHRVIQPSGDEGIEVADEPAEPEIIEDFKIKDE